MHESDDHLAALLKQAADAVGDRIVSASPAEIITRGTRHRRRRFAAIAIAACLAAGVVTGVATPLTQPDGGGQVEPATDPPKPSPPVPSESITVGGQGEATTSQPPGSGSSTTAPPDAGESTTLQPDSGSSTTVPPDAGDSATMTADSSG